MSWAKFAALSSVAYATGIVTGPIVLAAAAGMYFRGGSRKKTIVVVEKPPPPLVAAVEEDPADSLDGQQNPER